jgi:hypothetical protein
MFSCLSCLDCLSDSDPRKRESLVNNFSFLLDDDAWTTQLFSQLTRCQRYPLCSWSCTHCTRTTRPGTMAMMSCTSTQVSRTIIWWCLTFMLSKWTKCSIEDLHAQPSVRRSSELVSPCAQSLWIAPAAHYHKYVLVPPVSLLCHRMKNTAVWHVSMSKTTRTTICALASPWSSFAALGRSCYQPYWPLDGKSSSSRILWVLPSYLYWSCY